MVPNTRDAQNADAMTTPGGMLGRQQFASMLGEVSRRDRVAFTQLYEATSPKLYAIVLRIVRRRDLADDLLQEAYLRIWQHAGRFNPLRSSPMTWMATIARNCALAWRQPSGI